MSELRYDDLTDAEKDMVAEMIESGLADSEYDAIAQLEDMGEI